MSKKSTLLFFVLKLFSCSALLGIFACNPCHEVAEKMCECIENQNEREQCKTDLNLAKSHKFFEIAKEPKVCEEVMSMCTCEQLLRGEDEKCGRYRKALSGH